MYRAGLLFAALLAAVPLARAQEEGAPGAAPSPRPTVSQPLAGEDPSTTVPLAATPLPGPTPEPSGSFATEDPASPAPSPTPPFSGAPAAPIPLAATTPPPRSPLGWRATGLTAPLFRWHAGAGALGAVSDRYAGAEPGWLVQVAPRLLLERPPARVSGWLAYEPALQSRAGLPARQESPFDLEQRGRAGRDPSELETKVQHQGSVGFAVGDGVGVRLSGEAKHRVTLDQLRSEQEGLVEHVESTGAAAAEWIAADRWTLAARGSASRVRYPLETVRVEDHDRLDGSLEATARFHLRMTGTARVAAGEKRYRRAIEADGDPRVVRTVSATSHVEAQPMPSLSFRGGAGVSVRRDPEATVDVPIAMGATADFYRRYRASVDVGTALEDSLWRSNRHVRIYHSAARVGAAIRRDWDAALTAGASVADYPVRESPDGTALPRYRNDLTWGAGAELSCRPGGRFRAMLSVSHSERRSTFPGYQWEENRCVLSAYVDW